MRLITIKTFKSAIDAHILRSRLEGDGIRCFIKEGGINLQVRATDAEMAFALMAEVKAASTDEKEGTYFMPSIWF